MASVGTNRQLVETDARDLATAMLDALESPTCAVDTRGVIIAVNAAWLRYGSENGGHDVAALAVGGDYLAVCDRASGARSRHAAEVGERLRAVLDGRLARFEVEYACHAPGTQRWFSLRLSPLPGLGALVSHHDVTATRLAQRELRSRESLRDPVTGLPHWALHDRLEQALAESGGTGHLVGVAMVDVVDVDAVARRLGRDDVDELLTAVAGLLQPALRKGDCLGRESGGRFFVVWADLRSVAQGQELTGRLVSAFEEPMTVSGSVVQVTANIGVCLNTWDLGADEMLAAAEAAMSRARLRGPGQAEVVGPEARAPVARVVTPADLRAAMHRDELVLHYQPVVDLVSGTVTAVEALVRWQHPVDGLIGPDHFIPVAEAGGLIVALGGWVLERACAQAALWRSEGLDLHMAVNVSSLQVAHPDLLQTLQAVLLDSGLDPARLILELTESAVMEDAEAAVTVLSSIAELGVSLAIDDFGTGYSSLVYLKRYPIRALKIDRSFVAGMGISDEDDAIVASVIGLARAVGGSCIAEGIETQAQYAALHALGCDLGQGWLFGRAVPADELPGLVMSCEAQLTDGDHALPTSAEGRDDAGIQRDLAADTRDLRGDERDTAAEHRDQVGDRRDRVAQHRDQAGDSRDQLADVRDLVADQRDEAADDRDLAGQRRDQVGQRRDEAAADRDQAADRRDEVAELAEGESVPGAPVTAIGAAARARAAAASDRSRAAQDRGAGAAERTQAEVDRGTASLDRGAGAGERTDAESEREAALADRLAGADERTQAEIDRSVALADRGAGAGERWRAEQDRNVALADRSASARERQEATVDGLTGVLRRDFGFAELEREIVRARRTRQPLVIAFVDVDHLKSINDRFGHPAGDRLLVHVAEGLVAALRPYDLVLRYGGDEFVCALSGVDLATAGKRLGLINPALTASLEHGSVTIGLAQLQPDETLDALVARADNALYVQRQSLRGLEATARGPSDVPDEPLAG